MKTKDGVEVKKYSNYYLENGQEVVLNDFVTNSEGKTKFLVTPFYEGETMTVSCDGGSHQEYSMDYEHEGLEVLVDSIFDSEPTEKLGAEHKKVKKQIEELSKVVGFLAKKESDLNSLIFKSERETKEALKNKDLAIVELDKENDKLNKVAEKTQNRRQELSELEDSISSLKSEDVSSLISKTELRRLKKRCFELECLEAGGLNNWEWYSESLKEFRERYPNG
jgi:DNA repair exonuclease SbcCD ATPase subunit